MNGKRFSNEKARRNGFYLALAVCLVAVGVAAWSTYDAVNGVVEPAGADPGSSQLWEQQAEDVRSGQEEGAVEDQDPEEPVSAQEASPAPTPTPDAKETAGTASQMESAQPTGTPQPAATEESEQVPANGPLYAISTELRWPVEAQEVQKAYSAGAPVYSETMKDWRIHTGLDIAAESEAPVLACANGQVKETYTDSMLGNVVLVEHGPYQFYYCGVGENFLVNPGDVVTMGQQLGVVTAVPFEAAEEPHLHLEVRRDGVALDPQAVLEGTV